MHLHFEKYVICSSQESIRKSHSICIYPNQIVLVVALFFMPLYGRDKSLPRMLLHFSPVNNTNIKKSSMQWPKTTTKYNPPPKKKNKTEIPSIFYTRAILIAILLQRPVYCFWRADFHGQGATLVTPDTLMYYLPTILPCCSGRSGVRYFK
jgi:hypothetical protein